MRSATGAAGPAASAAPAAPWGEGTNELLGTNYRARLHYVNNRRATQNRPGGVSRPRRDMGDAVEDSLTTPLLDRWRAEGSGV